MNAVDRDKLLSQRVFRVFERELERFDMEVKSATPILPTPNDARPGSFAAYPFLGKAKFGFGPPGGE